MQRRRIVVASVIAAICVLALAGIGAAIRVHSPAHPSGSDRVGLGGTNVTEGDLTRPEQLRLIDDFAPFPTPPEAADIRLRYQRFQDISFDGSFALAPDQFDAYVRRLTPLGPTVGVRPGTGYAGKIVGAYTSVVIPDSTTHRIRITYVAG